MAWQHHFRRYASTPPQTPGQWGLWLLLWPLGFLYGVLNQIRVGLYRVGLFRTYRSKLPVVSVGNLTVGGTGKTPVVDAVARFYLERQKRVAIVSRGYGRSNSAQLVVVSAGNGPQVTAKVCGDEPYLLARRNPQAVVIVARRRRDGVIAAEEHGAEVVLLDDGFQHLAVARDLDIVLLDGHAPLGNGQVLPAGLLREFPRALSRGQLFIATRTEDCPCWPFSLSGPLLVCQHLLADYLLDLHGQRLPVAALAGKPGIAFSGIANPEYFFSDLTKAGLSLSKSFAFEDHADYGEELLALLQKNLSEAEFLVTTEKDGAKLEAAMFTKPCYQIPLLLKFKDRAPLDVALGKIVEKER